MTSSQSAVSYSDQQLRKSYQQMSREAQEMKRRRRRRFQSQVTVEEAVLMSNVEQEADNSKRNSEESGVVLKNQQEDFAMAMTSSRKIPAGSYIVEKSSRKHLKPTTGQPAASISLPPAGQPDASNSTSSLDMESSRKKADVVESYNPDARYPVAVFEASVVAQRIQCNQRSRWKNQWLRLSCANCLNSREQDLYYSGK
ncbi:Gamma-glutamyl transpeptidase 1 isoform 1 [Dorcoceras hygrometricum]|uniref:Gamma-glutamyl transpeptidase 1 isoform 1 n=1 Tax=Dorcoceras hygrometricum TaxID=472368 RepID=A0A2Z6ZZ86_9LAMI|nr:Gamma-glutamyl transpeptidase 1 isoform 1 [Dorcoceras hygrometricum]